MRGRSWLLLFLVSSSGACSLSSLDGFSGGNSQASFDGSATTDASIGDAALERAGDLDGGPVPFCSSLDPAPALCEDFDSDPALTSWKVERQGEGSDVATTTTAFRSAPRALRAAIGTPPGTRRAFLERDLPENAAHSRLSYSLYIDERPITGDLELNILRFRAGQAWGDFYFSVFKDGAHYVQQKGQAFTTVPLSRPVPLKTWVRIELEVILGNEKTIIVRVDGVEAARTTALYAVAAPPRVSLGITYTGDGPETGVVLVDDVTFEILP